MRPSWLNTKAVAVLAAATACVGVGGGALALAIADDDDGEPRTVNVAGGEGNPGSRRVVVDDLIPPADARRAAKAAENDAGGTALTVDHDDGLYEVEIQRADGRIIELYLDDRFRVVGSELEDDYDGFD
jgi:uncharacterized membrane protein YkoI